MKKVLIIISIFLVIFSINSSYAETENDTILKQKERFKVDEFLENAQKYKSEILEDIDIGTVLEEAINGKIDNSKFLKSFFGLFGKEVLINLKAFGSILAIIVIHSILKAISEGLKNSEISDLVYYVQYILIVTIIMSNFSDIILIVKDTVNNLVGFINILIPLLMTLMLFTGSITTSSIIEPIILFGVNFIGNIIQDIIIPLVLVFASLTVISKISDRIQIDKISKFMKSSVIWVLGILLTIFVGVVSLEGTLSSSIDGITSKTTKTVVSSAVPVVGKVLADAVDTVLGCGVVLKNAIGFVGVVIIIGICVVPILKLAILTITYKLLCSLVQPIADKKIVDLLDQVADIFKIFLGILCALSFMLIIGTTLVLRMSNGTIMYR